MTLVLEDDGLGFGEELGRQMFEQRVKGRGSKGHGLGLAFVEAVIRAHGGSVTACNRPDGGARLVISLPGAFERQDAQTQPLGVLTL